MGFPLQSQPDVCREAAPVSFVTAQTPPMMLVHGDADTNVTCGQSRALFAKLQQLAPEGPHEFYELPGATHFSSDRFFSPEMSQRFLAFAQRHCPAVA